MATVAAQSKLPTFRHWNQSRMSTHCLNGPLTTFLRHERAKFHRLDTMLAFLVSAKLGEREQSTKQQARKRGMVSGRTDHSAMH